jgi:predicted metal-dependent hydrolase
MARTTGDGERRVDALRSGGGLPDYSVRVSSRARRVRLVVTVDRGLEVVVPRGFDCRKIPGLVESRTGWIERAAARVEARAEAMRRRIEIEPPLLPDRIVLPAVGEEWEVEYRRAPSRSDADVTGATRTSRAVVRERVGRRLVLTGDLDDFEACRQALCRWLRRRAERALVPRVAEIARRHRLQHGSVSVRQQRTRWGSCSRRKTISVNAKLLFLAPALADYVLLHELCHTVVMDHSPRFWARVEAHDPHYQIHRTSLRRAGDAVPTWLDHKAGGSWRTAACSRSRAGV